MVMVPNIVCMVVVDILSHATAPRSGCMLSRPSWCVRARSYHRPKRLCMASNDKAAPAPSAAARGALNFEPPRGLGKEEEAARQLREWLRACRDSKVVLISGAGLSTESGIPDYRSPKGSYSKGHKPMQHDEFVGSLAGQQRYWARSMVGWKSFSRARPNSGHIAVKELQQLGVLDAVITQNVDGLHSKAGSANVIDLHGRSDLVRCLACDSMESRAQFQERLEELNPDAESEATDFRADGDAELQRGHADFAVPTCARCSGKQRERERETEWQSRGGKVWLRAVGKGL